MMSQAVSTDITMRDFSKKATKFTLRPRKLIVPKTVNADSSFNIKSEPNMNYLNDMCDYSTNKLINAKNVGTLNEVDENLARHRALSQLQNLDIHQTLDITKKLSRKDSEMLFTILALQLALDTKNTKVWQRRQQEQCMQMESKFDELINQARNRLKQHECIGAKDSMSDLYAVLEDMKILIREVTASAHRLGVLCYETRMVTCWNLVKSYVGMVKQDLRKESSDSSTSKRSSRPPTGRQTIRSKPELELVKNRNTRNLKNEKSSPVQIWQVQMMIFFIIFAAVVIISYVQCQHCLEGLISGIPPYY